MPRYTWTDGLCRVSLTMTMEQALSCSAPGEQLDNARALVKELQVQLADADVLKVRAVLRDCGFDKESLDDGDNLARLVWVAACDISDAPSQFRI